MFSAFFNIAIHERPAWLLSKSSVQTADDRLGEENHTRYRDKPY
jgi:hypothetical protein